MLTGTGRIYVYQNYEAKDGKLYMDPVYKVQAVETNAETGPSMQDEPYSLFPWWYNHLSQNQIINSRVEDMPEEERNVLEHQNVKSVLAIPIFFDQKWFGFIGFDNTYRNSVWQDDEVQLLKTTAEIMAAFKKEHPSSKHCLSNEITHRRYLTACQVFFW